MSEFSTELQTISTEIGTELRKGYDGAVHIGQLLTRAAELIGGNSRFKRSWTEWALDEFPDESKTNLSNMRNAAEVAEIIGDTRGASLSALVYCYRVVSGAKTDEDRATGEGLLREYWETACKAPGVKRGKAPSVKVLKSVFEAEGADEGSRGPDAGSEKSGGGRESKTETDADESSADESTDEPTETGDESTDETSERNTPTAGETTPETDAAALVAANGTLERLLQDRDADEITALLPVILATVTACESHGISVMFSTVKTFTNKHKSQVRRNKQRAARNTKKS